MSFILDALKKSQRDHDSAASPDVSHRGIPSHTPVERLPRQHITPLVFVLGVLFLTISGGGFYWLVNARSDQAGTPAKQRQMAKTAPTAPAVAPTAKKKIKATLPTRPKPKPKPKSSTNASATGSDTKTAGYYDKRGRKFELEGLFKRAVEEYTKAISADPDFVEAYLGRGWAHEENGAHELAIRSYTQAIERKPNYAAAYLGRGWAYEQLGKTDLAIREYSQAIKSTPNYAEAYMNRGILNFYQNRMGQAAADFSMVIKDGNASMRRYALLWLYLAKSRTGANGKREIEKKLRATDLAPWPGVIVSMYLGRVGPGQVISATKNINPRKQLEKECVAFFFLGQYQLIMGHRDKAAKYFNKTLATGITYFRQYGAAKAELRRMGKL